ncbi:DarT ssDNA thymidine ADP-ribosyltransferase family protein [Stenotrophomonas sp. LARHCG68]
MPARFAFRQIDKRDLALILRDGEIRSKNHVAAQSCHQTSHADIVGFRNTPAFEMPYGGVVNDYVPFYFSPITAFTYVIHQGGVQTRAPSGDILGASCITDRIFLVSRVSDIEASDVAACISDFALNSLAPMPTVIPGLSDLEEHVAWSLFDEHPRVGKVEEIGYEGVCQYFFDRAVPVSRQHRKSARMAELLVKDTFPTSLLCGIVVPRVSMLPRARELARQYGFTGQVISKPGCFL